MLRGMRCGRFKRRMQGSFVIGEEGGPYIFSFVNYNFDTGKIEFRYTRPQQNSVPTLYFLGKWANDTLTGSISGLRDSLGKFSVKTR